MEEFKTIDLKSLSPEQKRVIKHINNMIIEYQEIFQDQPEELIVSSKDFKILSEEKEYKYLKLSNIKIFSI